MVERGSLVHNGRGLTWGTERKESEQGTAGRVRSTHARESLSFSMMVSSGMKSSVARHDMLGNNRLTARHFDYFQLGKQITDVFTDCDDLCYRRHSAEIVLPTNSHNRSHKLARVKKMPELAQTDLRKGASIQPRMFRIVGRRPAAHSLPVYMILRRQAAITFVLEDSDRTTHYSRKR
jgi:hypothetical protein